MDCPKCAHSIRDASAAECPACGVLLNKAAAHHRPHLVVERPQPVAPKPAFSIPLRAIVAIFVVAIAVIYTLGRQRDGVTTAAAEGWYLGGEGYERARSAQASGQAILLYFYADW